jgi:formiminotetrahydrofolate cyclodeaminase
MTEDFLTELARPRPDPGGGAAAAFSARVAVALLSKVAHLEHRRRRGNQGGPGPEDERLAELERLAVHLRELQEADVRAYERLSRARAAGSEALLDAVAEATETPGRIIAAAVQGLALVAAAGRHCRRHLVADLKVAAELLAGAGRGAAAIALANLPLCPEAESQRTWQSRLQQALSGLEGQAARTHETLRARGGGVQA